MPPDDYDAIPYDDRPVAQTHPDRLYATARAHGLRTAPPDRAHILELGCAHAVNLLPMAAALPNARLLGIDRAASQIARAADDIRTTGLGNLEVRCADVMTLDPTVDLGDARFDYVIAHGLLSWVPDAVRDRVLSLCSEVLAPDGVVYLSYNAMPAWGLRGGVRRALLEFVDATASPRTRVDQARAALAWLGEDLDDTAEGVLLADEIEHVRRRSDSYLLHEYLVPEARAYWLREFMTLAEGVGLAYVDELAPTGLDDDDFAAVRARLEGRVADPVAREQLLDVMVHRQFRATVLAHREAPRDLATAVHEPLPARPSIARSIAARPRVSAVTRLEATRYTFVTTPAHACAEMDPLHRAVVLLLDGTRTVPDVVTAVAQALHAGRLGVDGPIAAVERALPRLVDGALARLLAAGLLVALRCASPR